MTVTRAMLEACYHELTAASCMLDRAINRDGEPTIDHGTLIHVQMRVWYVQGRLRSELAEPLPTTENDASHADTN